MSSGESGSGRLVIPRGGRGNCEESRSPGVTACRLTVLPVDQMPCQSVSQPGWIKVNNSLRCWGFGCTIFRRYTAVAHVELHSILDGWFYFLTDHGV